MKPPDRRDCCHLAVLVIDRRDLPGSEACWQNDLQHLDVIAVTKFAVTDVGRLVHA